MQEFIIKTLGFGFVAFLISASLIMCDRSYQKECKVYEAEKISRYGKEALRLEDESCKNIEEEFVILNINYP